MKVFCARKLAESNKYKQFPSYILRKRRDGETGRQGEEEKNKGKRSVIKSMNSY